MSGSGNLSCPMCGKVFKPTVLYKLEAHAATCGILDPENLNLDDLDDDDDEAEEGESDDEDYKGEYEDEEAEEVVIAPRAARAKTAKRSAPPRKSKRKAPTLARRGRRRGDTSEEEEDLEADEDEDDGDEDESDDEFVAPESPAKRRRAGSREEPTAPVAPTPPKTGTSSDGRVHCPICGRLMEASMIVQHAAACRTVSQLHESEQSEFYAIELSREIAPDVADHLSEMQKQALEVVKGQAKRASDKAYAPLLKRVQAMGYSESQLRVVLSYLRSDAPMIIHLSAAVVELLIKDTHYRVAWEDRLFNNVYHNAKPFDRVKYGVLNIVSDPRGVRAALHYGDCYLVLGPSVRFRSTFANKDTGWSDAIVCTTEFYNHVLTSYSDPELKDVMDVGTGIKLCESSERVAVYKEMQVHGDVRLDRDVAMLVMNNVHKTNKRTQKAAESFAEKHGVPVIWMEEP
ncbi:hypothetical protein HK101_001768 [Irineochytrium annulatum]|nr:hypothetical protein HK101_001768 [Irineochytrium annulatum]